MSHPIIIGITGKAGTGKSTVSHEMVRLYGFTRLAFADPVKGMLGLFLMSYGMSANMVARHIDGDLKEQPCDALEGLTCRQGLQTLGTEWGREKMSPRLWLHHLGARLESLPPEKRARVVIDDVRMPNEAEYLLHNFGGTSTEIWEVTPQGAARRDPPSHASELGLPQYLVDRYIWHNFTMPTLALSLGDEMGRLGLERVGVWAS